MRAKVDRDKPETSKPEHVIDNATSSGQITFLFAKAEPSGRTGGIRYDGLVPRSISRKAP
jgi:hypothetical protein